MWNTVCRTGHPYQKDTAEQGDSKKSDENNQAPWKTLIWKECEKIGTVSLRKETNKGENDGSI